MLSLHGGVHTGPVTGPHLPPREHLTSARQQAHGRKRL